MPEFYNALEFMSNEDGNNILNQFVSALGVLSMEILDDVAQPKLRSGGGSSRRVSTR